MSAPITSTNADAIGQHEHLVRQIIDEGTGEPADLGGSGGPSTDTIATILDRGNDADGQRIVNLQDPVDPQDAATRQFVEDNTGGSTPGIGDVLDAGNDGLGQNFKNAIFTTPDGRTKVDLSQDEFITLSVDDVEVLKFAPRGSIADSMDLTPNTDTRLFASDGGNGHQVWLKVNGSYGNPGDRMTSGGDTDTGGMGWQPDSTGRWLDGLQPSVSDNGVGGFIWQVIEGRVLIDDTLVTVGPGNFGTIAGLDNPLVANTGVMLSVGIDGTVYLQTFTPATVPSPSSEWPTPTGKFLVYVTSAAAGEDGLEFGANGHDLRGGPSIADLFGTDTYEAITDVDSVRGTAGGGVASASNPFLTLALLGAQTIARHSSDVSNGLGSSFTQLAQDGTSGSMQTNGNSVSFEYAGVFAGDASHNVQLKVVYDNVLMLDSGSLAVTAAATWRITGQVIRISNTVVRYDVSLVIAGGFSAVQQAVGEITGLDLANDGDYILVQGKGVTIAALVTLKLGTVVAHP